MAAKCRIIFRGRSGVNDVGGMAHPLDFFMLISRQFMIFYEEGKINNEEKKQKKIIVRYTY